ncbi:hypothetical protein FRB99_004355, partial [Tulasnella sp. 403]
MMSFDASHPLIAVIGTTGTGKSQLAIELALAISDASKATSSQYGRWKGAKVINADAMQVYRGLDIVTNKVTEEEKQGVEHRLMDIRSPGEEYFVSQWIKDAVSEIESCHAAEELPIIVGGTTYWIQHLIFPNRLVSLEDGTEDDHDASVGSVDNGISSTWIDEVVSELPESLQRLWKDLPDKAASEVCTPDVAFSLHTLLSKLDPPVAARWHWNDTRKVLRSLEIIKESGRKASEIMMQQDGVTVNARYPTLVFWLYAEPHELNPRLDARVQKMIERGMLQEIITMRELCHPKVVDPPTGSEAPSIDYTQGIFQTIGFKEFDQYLSSTTRPDDLFAHSVEQMKHATRKYAQRQIKWIQNKLLPVVRSQGTEGHKATVVLLDATRESYGQYHTPWELNPRKGLDAWDTNVRELGKQVLQGEGVGPLHVDAFSDKAQQTSPEEIP